MRLSTFIVRTLHPAFPGRYSVPIEIEASTPLEAARARFNMQTPCSQGETTALLVEYKSSHPHCYVFEVENVPARLEVVAPS